MSDWPEESFLLESKSAIRLYDEFAEELPIIDYHNHLSPKLIADNHPFNNMTDIWLDGDHYKWRAMRACGVDENLITGDASDQDKFNAWAATVPRLIGSPLYHWTHLELANPFGIVDKRLNPQNADGFWSVCGEMLSTPEFQTRALISRAYVKVLCTTDDPCDSLIHHKLLSVDNSFETTVLPTFRPDPVLGVEDVTAWNTWVDKLSGAAGHSISDWRSLLSALENRIAFFSDHGCRLSDHGLEVPLAAACTPDEAAAIFATARNGEALNHKQAQKIKSAILYELGLRYHELGWTQQFHIGALRNVNTRVLNNLGRDAGCDTIGDAETARPLARMLDNWDKDNRLAKTILYNVNPRDNALMTALAGSFNDGGTPGKIQHGTAWWFNDQRDGIEQQLSALANIGVLSTFVGMVTDSRSFLSFSRHDYFRRILCNYLGGQMDRGELPDDFNLVGGVVQDICYNNAERHFGFNE